MSTRVVADENANLLEVHYIGHVRVADMDACLKDIQSLLASLRPDFTVLTNLILLESMEIACVPYIDKIMDLCRIQGVGKVVRIIPKPEKDIGFNVMSLFHYPHRVTIITCENLAEAERALK